MHSKIFRSIVFTILAVLLLAGALWAKHRDIVYLMNGDEHTGELLKISATEIVLGTSEGEMTFPKDSVRSIDLGRWRPGDDWHTEADIDDPVLLKAIESTGGGMTLGMKYPTAGQILIYEKGVLTINEDMSATLVERSIYFINGERGKSVANFSRTYFDDVASVEFNFGRAITREGKISTLADNAIEDGSTRCWLAEYQRQRSKKFAMTGAEVGNIIDYQVTTHFERFDEFNGLELQWNFYSTEPILESILEVKYHKSLDLEFHETALTIEPEKSKDGAYQIRTYAMKDIEPYIEETMMPNTDWILPNVLVTMPEQMKNLSRAYHAKIVEATDAVDRVEEIIKNEFKGKKPTVEEIYNYVSENFTSNWVYFNSYYPYPKPLSKLLESSRVADHELDYLLYIFLTAAGYDAQLVICGPGLNSPEPADMYNIRFFNGLSVKVDDSGTIRYLSPNEFRRFDHQNLNALYILPISEKGSKLEKIERLPGKFAYSTPDYKCKLHPDGTMDVNYTIEYHGPTGGDGYRWHKNDKPRELDNYFQKKAKGIDEMANLVDFKLTGYKDLRDKVFVEYNVTIPGYAVRAGEEILAFKIPTVAFGAWDVGAKERKLPFGKSGNVYAEKRITIELPKGYEIDYIPESQKLSVGYREFSADIELKGNSIIYNQITRGTNKPIIESEKYPEYKKYVEDMAKFGDSWILIRKK